MKKTPFALLGLAMLAGCAQPAPSPVAAPTVASPTVAAPGLAAPAVAPGAAGVVGSDGETRWDVERVTCEQMLAATDEDRAAASMFYYGYLAAKNGLRVLDPQTIESDLKAVMALCGTQPKTTMPAAFRQALAKPKR